jgi:ABC-type transport system substrate-binding protein
VARQPSFQIKYDPAAAKKLMSEAGYSAAKPLKVKVQTSASGSGQMQPLPMNEFMQQNLKECFFDVEFDVVEWNTLFTNWRIGAKDRAHGANAINVSFATMDPFFAMVRFVSTKAARRCPTTGASTATRGGCRDRQGAHHLRPKA